MMKNLTVVFMVVLVVVATIAHLTTVVDGACLPAGSKCTSDADCCANLTCRVRFFILGEPILACQ
ncbi:hypothetical protein RND81_09G188800 [Saponaria officinalis]|uniref:Uncharacterized protein n=1 Tax=Saponaria officinalis TaxID=3572 RepID=A0AAW1INQ6_SAPOF